MSQSHVTRHWHESTERKQHPIRRALYLDTEGTFRPDRLEPIAARYELDLDFVLENVIHARFLNWCVRGVLGLSTWCPAGRPIQTALAARKIWQDRSTTARSPTARSPLPTRSGHRAQAHIPPGVSEHHGGPYSTHYPPVFLNTMVDHTPPTIPRCF